MNFVDLINRRLVEEEEKRQKAERTRKGHYPTSASILTSNGNVVGECLLKIYRDWNGVKPTNPFAPDTLQKLAWGNLFHDWATTILEKECLDGRLNKLERKVKFQSKVDGLTYPISGEIDNIVNGSVGLEIKTSYGKFFFSKDGLLNSGPKLMYLMQVLCYLQVRKDLEYFVMLFLARDIGFKVQYNIYRDGTGIKTVRFNRGAKEEKKYPEITFERIIARWQKLEEHLVAGKEPERDYQYKTKYPCCYCIYHDMCYEKNG